MPSGPENKKLDLDTIEVYWDDLDGIDGEHWKPFLIRRILQISSIGLGKQEEYLGKVVVSSTESYSLYKLDWEMHEFRGPILRVWFALRGYTALLLGVQTLDSLPTAPEVGRNFAISRIRDQTGQAGAYYDDDRSNRTGI